MISRRTPQGSQPLAAAMSRFDFMEQFSMLKTLVSASGG